MPTPHIPPNLARHIADGRAERAFAVERKAVDEAARTATLAFASELAYERYWGIEILDCTAGAMRSKRLRGGANLLCDHNTQDVVGVVESVEIGADRVARAVVRFGKSARAEEVWQDVLGGIRRNVSVGYMVHKAVLVEEAAGVETYRVTDWEPFEVSLVSVPADASVGIGRSLPAAVDIAPPEIKTPLIQRNTMSDTPVIETPAQRNHASEISKIAAGIPGGPELAMKSIQASHTVEQFQAELVRHLSTKPVPTSDIGMTKAEVKKFSVVRAIHALSNPADAAAQRAAAFEFEASGAVATKMGKAARGFFMPTDVQKRDLTAAVAADGGRLVTTDLLSGSFIDMLRNMMVIDRLGARMLTGLTGLVAIPKQSGAASAFWVAENGAPTESQQTLAQVLMSPKTVGAFTDISRRLTLQSSVDVENLVTTDLATVLGLAIQQAAINGTGASNQPSGILTQVTASVIGGTNGLAPTWQNIVDLETNVANGNADVGTMGYLVNARTRGRLKTTQKFASTNGMPVWDGGATPVNGYNAAVTNAVPSNLVKGTSGAVCSALIFGNFADLLIGMWGSLDIMVDPYTGGTAGTVRVIALQDVDVAIRNVESFATMVDALTT